MRDIFPKAFAALCEHTLGLRFDQQYCTFENDYAGCRWIVIHWNDEVHWNAGGSIVTHRHTQGHAVGQNIMWKLCGSYAGIRRDCKATFSIEVHVMSNWNPTGSTRILEEPTAIVSESAGILQIQCWASWSLWTQMDSKRSPLESIGIRQGPNLDPQKSQGNS